MLNFLAENFIFSYIGVSMFTFPKHHFDWLFILTGFVSCARGKGQLNCLKRKYWLYWLPGRFVRLLDERQIFTRYRFYWTWAVNRRSPCISSTCSFSPVGHECLTFGRCQNFYRNGDYINVAFCLFCRSARCDVICVSHPKYGFRSTAGYADDNVANCDCDSDHAGWRDQLSPEIFPDTVRVVRLQFTTPTRLSNTFWWTIFSCSISRVGVEDETEALNQNEARSVSFCFLPIHELSHINNFKWTTPKMWRQIPVYCSCVLLLFRCFTHSIYTTNTRRKCRHCRHCICLCINVFLSPKICHSLCWFRIFASPHNTNSFHGARCIFHTECCCHRYTIQWKTHQRYVANDFSHSFMLCLCKTFLGLSVFGAFFSSHIVLQVNAIQQMLGSF